MLSTATLASCQLLNAAAADLNTAAELICCIKPCPQHLALNPASLLQVFVTLISNLGKLLQGSGGPIPHLMWIAGTMACEYS